MSKYDIQPCCNDFKLACTCPPGGKWLTREDVEPLLWPFKDRPELIKEMLDELFGDDNATEK